MQGDSLQCLVCENLPIILFRFKTNIYGGKTPKRYTCFDRELFHVAALALRSRKPKQNTARHLKQGKKPLDWEVLRSAIRHSLC